MKIVFKSPLEINECVEKIREARNTQSSTVFLYHHILPFAGDIQNNRICLGYRSGGRNSFSPVFLGKFSSINNTQTVLTGKLVLHPFVKAFMVFWMSLASFSASLSVAAKIRDSLIGQKAFQIEALYGDLLFPIGGLLLLLFGNALGQSDGKAILNLLEKSLKAISVERVSSSSIFSWSNLISTGVIALFIITGTVLGLSSNIRQYENPKAELTSFYTCNISSETECTSTSYFSEKPKEIFACGYIKTTSRSSVNIYWYHGPVGTPIYYNTDIWLSQGFFCEKLDIAKYDSGSYIVKVYQNRNVLGQYNFVIK